MVDVLEIMKSKEFACEAVSEAIELLNGELTYEDYGWDDALLEAGSLDDFTYRHDGTDWGKGATKVCIIFRGFVLKSGYSNVHVYEANSCEDFESSEDWDNNNNDNYTSYEWDDCDYCNIESRVYEAALKAGVARFFAPTYRIGNTNVYIQPRCGQEAAYTNWFEHLGKWGICKYEKRFGADAFDALRSELKLNVVPRAVFSYWLDTGSYMQLKALGEFLDKHYINDLHSHNIGWFDGEVKLFDYSGYHSGTEETLD